MSSSKGIYMLVLEVEAGKYSSGNREVISLGTKDYDEAVKKAEALLKGDPNEWRARGDSFSTEGSGRVMYRGQSLSDPTAAWLVQFAEHYFDLDKLQQEAEVIRDKVILDAQAEVRKAQYEKLKQEFGP